MVASLVICGLHLCLHRITTDHNFSLDFGADVTFPLDYTFHTFLGPSLHMNFVVFCCVLFFPLLLLSSRTEWEEPVKGFPCWPFWCSQLESELPPILSIFPCTGSSRHVLPPSLPGFRGAIHSDDVPSTAGLMIEL